MVDGVAQAYQWITFQDAEQQVASLSAALKAVGLQRLDKVGVLGTNSPQWMLAMQVRMCACCTTLGAAAGLGSRRHSCEHVDGARDVAACSAQPLFCPLLRCAAVLCAGRRRATA
jgi:long-chain acyl-CoA synthetase